MRLIAILRDPVERACSHHLMSVMNGLERRPIDVAIEEQLLPEALEEARRLPNETNGYVTWGEYGRILAGYFDVFPSEQLLIVFTDELARAPAQLMRRLYEFIGVDPSFVPPTIGARFRVGGSSRRLRWLQLDPVQQSAAANDTARSLWHSMPEGYRRRIDRTFDTFAYRLELWNRRQGFSLPETLQPQTLMRLRGHFAADAALLEGQLGIEPPWVESPLPKRGVIANLGSPAQQASPLERAQLMTASHEPIRAAAETVRNSPLWWPTSLSLVYPCHGSATWLYLSGGDVHFTPSRGRAGALAAPDARQ